MNSRQYGLDLAAIVHMMRFSYGTSDQLTLLGIIKNIKFLPGLYQFLMDSNNGQYYVDWTKDYIQRQPSGPKLIKMTYPHVNIEGLELLKEDFTDELTLPQQAYIFDNLMLWESASKDGIIILFSLLTKDQILSVIKFRSSFIENYDDREWVRLVSEN